MQRTQIYLEEEMLFELKKIAKSLNISVSEFIRRTLQKEVKYRQKSNLSYFLKTMKPIESFENIDASQYVENLRSKSRLLSE